ncbi:alpha/beta fold hydrolase [Enterovibrio calviensis]|uniref:alpha/beta fold hydrolase n=1 Tax=Enterovibrio calviensis TaxID=91359 RepID=UPI000488CD45|nr:alpha/beta fold hydrolase [Enterovibrio calviensis]
MIQIYDAAADPDKWPVLIRAVAELVEKAAEKELSLTSENNYANIGNYQSDDVPLGNALTNVSNLSIPSDLEMTDYSQPELDLILLRYFQSALGIAQKLNAEEEYRDVIGALLDHLPISVMIVDQDGYVIESNLSANQMISDNSLLDIANNRLMLNGDGDNAKLHSAIKHVASATGEVSSKALMFGQSELSLERIMVFVSAVKGMNDSEGCNNIALFLSSPRTQPITISDSIAQLYGLTAKELEVASYLVRGFSVKEISIEMFISEHTSRSHLKSLMAKTRTQRQAELVRILFSSPTSMLDQVRRYVDLKEEIEHQGISRVRVNDDRMLAYRDIGAANSVPILYLHSVVGASAEIETMLSFEDIAALNCRIIAPDRPGYGLSSLNKKPGFNAFNQDLKALLEHLDIPCVYILGFSMGALYGMAFAREYPERVTKVIGVSAGLASTEKSEFAIMNPLWRMSMTLARDIPNVYRLVAGLMFKSMRKDRSKVLELIEDSVVLEEAAIFRDKRFAEIYSDSLGYAWQQGLFATCKDTELLMKKLSFSPEEIHTPVTLWHGAKDRHVPFTVVERLAKRLPNVELKVEPHLSHFLILLKIREIIENDILVRQVG